MTPSPPDPTIFQTLWVLEAHPWPLTSLESIFLELPPRSPPPKWLLPQATDHIHLCDPTLGKNSLLFISSACSSMLEVTRWNDRTMPRVYHLYPHCRKECVYAGDWQLGTYAWLVICLLFCYHHSANRDAPGGGQGWFWQILTRLRVFRHEHRCDTVRDECKKWWPGGHGKHESQRCGWSEIWLIRGARPNSEVTEHLCFPSALLPA